MAGLALLYIATGFFQDHPSGILNESTLSSAEFSITLVFLAEFLLRLYAAHSRRAYLTSHWVDLLALLPAIRWLRFLRLGRLIYLLRMARVLRLGVLVRFLVELNRIGDDIRGIVVRNGVHIFLTLAVGLAVIGGTLVWELEHTINPSFSRYDDAIWWAFATMTTVGYGNGPVTLAGRVVAAVVMIAGIASFGVITATVTAFFLRPRTSHHETQPDDLLVVLEDIRTRLARIEQGQTDHPPTITDPPSLPSPANDQPPTTS